jgi:hypothetical protein
MVPKKNAIMPILLTTPEGKVRCSITHTPRWNAYEEEAVYRLRLQYRALSKTAIDKPVWVQALYYPPNGRSLPDLSAVLETVGDLLQWAGVIVNDGLIVSWADSRIGAWDPLNPRCEIEVRLWEPEKALTAGVT